MAIISNDNEIIIRKDVQKIAGDFVGNLGIDLGIRQAREFADGGVGRDAVLALVLLAYDKRMQDAARRMQILLHDLLTLSRVTSKAQPFGPVDLRKVVQDVVSNLEVRIEQTGAEVEIGNLPIIDADAAQMLQLFQNLLSNALKFQPPGSRPEVSISAKVLDNAESLPGAMPGEEICQIAEAGAADVEKAVRAARAAFDRGPWRKLAASQRPTRRGLGGKET